MVDKIIKNKIIRGQLVSFGDLATDYYHEAKGVLVIDDDGRIKWFGAFTQLPLEYITLPCDDWGDRLIMPGFIDTHIHFPQYRMLAASAKDLLDWLNRFAFPEEMHCSQPDYAKHAATIFVQRLFEHGTTAALAFSSVHLQATDCLFAAAYKYNMALISGKTLMDRGAPPTLLDTPQSAQIDSIDLYNNWHGRGRLKYAITPRFAITSSEQQLAVCRELMQDLPAALLHTHLSESKSEIEMVASLFPNDNDYLSVYNRFGLVTEKSLFAHAIHLSDNEYQMLHEAKSAVIHCPISNSFLGSDMMRKTALDNILRPISHGIATDVGGGSSFSMLHIMAEAYKVQMQLGNRLSAFDLFHWVTRANAKILKLDNEIGSIDIGKWADIVVLDYLATPVLASRDEISENIEDRLFALALLGDDRAVSATYVAGEKVFSRNIGD